MIIDVHGHMSAPAELWAYKAVQLAGRGAHGRGKVTVSDDQIRESYHAKETFGAGHVDLLDKHGTDFQLISPDLSKKEWAKKRKGRPVAHVEKVRGDDEIDDQIMQEDLDNMT